MKKTALAAALLLASGVVNAAAINYLEITGGSFGMNGGTPDSFQINDLAVMTVGGYDGAAPSAPGPWNDISIVQFEFGTNGTVLVRTAETDGALSGFAAPSGDITGGAATLNLDSWTAWWSGSSFNQGSTSTMVDNTVCAAGGDFVTRCSTAVVVDSYNAATGEFTASWNSVVQAGSFKGSLGNWQISGIMGTNGNPSAIPVPAAVWLFGSGLIGLAGIARRRKSA